MSTSVEAQSAELAEIPTKPESAIATSEKKDYSKVCRFFKQGFCGFAEKCLYSHGKPKNRPRQGNCPFYKKASCKFATKCWYSHIGRNGKPYRKPDPYNKFIVVGPSGFEQTGDALETKPHRKFKRPQNIDVIPKNCFYYEKKGVCNYNEKCWYTHNEPCLQDPPLNVSLYATDPAQETDQEHNKMCYDFTFDVCEFKDTCRYVHGDICQFCDLPLLHPFDEQQRKDHLAACEIFFLEDMEISFAFMRSKIQTCVICLDNVWGLSKPLYTDWQFGIQDNCNHVFCLYCIRHWRNRKNVRRDCPACRVESSVVVPSTYWFIDDEEKQKWVEAYKNAVFNKPCKYYERGRCRNKDRCHFLHSGYVPPPPEEENQDANWGYLDSNNELPSREQEAPGNGVEETADITDDHDHQDARGRDVQDTNVLNDVSPDDQPNEDLPLQSNVGVTTGDLAGDHQRDVSLQQVNITDDGNGTEETADITDDHDHQDARGNVQDTNVLNDVLPDDQPNEDLTLQSGAGVNTGNLADDHQFDASLEQVNISDDSRDTERHFGQNPDTSDNMPSKKESIEDFVLHTDQQIHCSNLPEEMLPLEEQSNVDSVLQRDEQECSGNLAAEMLPSEEQSSEDSILLTDVQIRGSNLGTDVGESI